MKPGIAGHPEELTQGQQLNSFALVHNLSVFVKRKGLFSKSMPAWYTRANLNPRDLMTRYPITLVLLTLLLATLACGVGGPITRRNGDIRRVAQVIKGQVSYTDQVNPLQVLDLDWAGWIVV